MNMMNRHDIESEFLVFLFLVLSVAAGLLLSTPSMLYLPLLKCFHGRFFQTSFALCLPKRYTFYDGPPFATGLPHYGHILAGTIKDIVTRFAHQSGFHVERRFGWDCHGLPVVRILCCISQGR